MCLGKKRKFIKNPEQLESICEMYNFYLEQMKEVEICFKGFISKSKDYNYLKYI